MRRIWLWFVAVAVVLIGANLAFLRWRERSLEPLSAPVDLSRPSAYTFVACGFHTSTYYPSFSLELPFRPDLRDWFPEADYRRLWDALPPVVRITVHDARGHLVLSEESALTRSDQWIVTGAPGTSYVEIYKFARFDGRLFERYRVTLRVLRGSPAAASFQPRFAIRTTKAYELLPAVLGFFLLLALLVIAAIVIGVVQMGWGGRVKP
jgi:hypothetical protein